MPSDRIKFWTHQEMNGSQKGDGGNSLWTLDYWTSGGFISPGSTLLRTQVTGYFTLGVIWDPADTPPFSDVLASSSIDFAVYVDTENPSPGPPTPLNDNASDTHIVWRETFKCVSTSTVQPFATGQMYSGLWVPQGGELDKSLARRGPADVDGGQVQFLWWIQSPYAATLDAFTTGYSVGGVVFDWVLAGQISVDQLWDSAPF